jgi:hypothetical protein
MRSVVTMYTLSTQASLLSFLFSAFWGGVLALRKQPISETYKLILVASHIIMALSYLLLVVLALTRVLPRSGLSFIYSFVALATLPCVYAYLPEEQPRFRVSSLALACFFASGMVLRSLQVLSLLTLQGDF